MSHKVQQLILAAGLLGLAAGAWAHGEHHHHHHCEDGWRGRMMGEGRMMGGGAFMLTRGLNLSEAQKQQIHTILATARQNAIRDSKAGGMADRLALMNPGDPNYAAAIQTATKRAADRIQQMSELRQQIYNVLTPEQKSEVQKRIASWKTRMAQREEAPAVPPPGPPTGPPAPANR